MILKEIQEISMQVIMNLMLRRQKSPEWGIIFEFHNRTRKMR